MMFARDSFRGADGIWGGDYVDLTTPFGARDKVLHFICGALLFAAVDRDGPACLAGLCVLVGGLTIELLEADRLARGKTFFADDPSWRDLVANLAGAAVAWLLL